MTHQKPKFELTALAKQAMERLHTLTPSEKRAMWEAQRKSYVESVTTPCQHGVLDFETCPDCRAGK